MRHDMVSVTQAGRGRLRYSLGDGCAAAAEAPPVLPEAAPDFCATDALNPNIRHTQMTTVRKSAPRRMEGSPSLGFDDVFRLLCPLQPCERN